MMKRFALPLAALALAACASRAEPEHVAASAEAVVGSVASTADQDAVVLVVGYDAKGAETYTCSGTLVASNVVLTARHCVSGLASEEGFECDENVNPTNVFTDLTQAGALIAQAKAAATAALASSVPTPAPTSTTGAPSTAPPIPPQRDSGCAISHETGSGDGAFALLTAVVIAALRRRSRTRHTFAA